MRAADFCKTAPSDAIDTHPPSKTLAAIGVPVCAPMTFITTGLGFPVCASMSLLPHASENENLRFYLPVPEGYPNSNMYVLDSHLELR